MKLAVRCEQCGVSETLFPSQARTYRFCSYACRGEWRKTHFRGAENPHWIDGVTRVKQCQHCGTSFTPSKSGIGSFRSRRFCGMECARLGQLRYSGSEHPLWKGGGLGRRPASHYKWADQIITRDGGRCRSCGRDGVQLHAHHIKPYKDYPELRMDLDNGIALCAPCHWATHRASAENGVNSGNPQRQDGGNPEPSLRGNVREGVTTRGQAYRRVDFACEWCFKPVSRRLSDYLGKPHHFCGKSCARRYAMTMRYGGHAPTSALPERDEIV